MFSNISFYIYLLIAIIVGAFMLKKITSCLLKIVLFLVFVALAVWLYYAFFA